MADTFEEILGQQVTEVKVPPPIPAGTYLMSVDGNPTQAEVGADKTKCLDFNARILMPQGDVSQAELAAFDGGVQGKTMRLRFFLTDRSLFMLDRFLFEHLGIELGKPRKQAVAEAIGRQFYGTVKHTPRDDGQGFYANITGTAKA